MAKAKKKAVVIGKKSTGPVVPTTGTGPSSIGGKSTKGPVVPTTGTGPKSGFRFGKALPRPAMGRKTSRKGK